MTKCTKCGKEHAHYHIEFFTGAKNFSTCFDCCELCKEARDKGYAANEKGVLEKVS